MNDNELKHYGRSKEEDPSLPIGTGNWRRAWSPRHPGHTNLESENNEKKYELLKRKIKALEKQGLTQKQIAKNLGYKSTTELRKAQQVATHYLKEKKFNEVKRLSADGKGPTEIEKLTGIPEGTVRSMLKSKYAVEGDLTKNAVDKLREVMQENKYIDVSKGIERWLGITPTRLQTAIGVLEEEGFVTKNVQVEQLGTKPGQKTLLKVLAPPGTSYSDINQNKDQINATWFVQNRSEDGGVTFEKPEMPRSVDSSRIKIVYKEEGGVDKDGVIELRPGVEELSLHNAKYAQVRIAVDDKYYLKGMAVYNKNMPEGYDIIVNSNKHIGTPKEEVFKKMKMVDGKVDINNPFGALTKSDSDLYLTQKHYIDKNGKKQLSCLNIVNEQGDWFEWNSTLSSQFLSKQLPATIRKQLNLTAAQKQDEFNDIKKTTNPIVRQALLEEFSDECDASAVHLKAIGFAGQRSHVLLPINALKEGEVYAPNYENGTKLALVRHPHAGPFEIPVLTVNNKNKEGREIIGNAHDAIGIRKEAFDQLSGADADGDTATTIPIKNRRYDFEFKIPELVNFDPKTEFAIDKSKKFTEAEEEAWNKDHKAARKEFPDIKGKIPRITSKEKGKQMGIVSNLITDMQLKSAPMDDIVRAVKHSMVVIDSEKHYLNYKASEKLFGIDELKKKYQMHPDGTYGGASTLISRAKSEVREPEVAEFQGTSKMTPEQLEAWNEGKRVYYKTGKTHSYPDKSAGVNENGKPNVWIKVPNESKRPWMETVDDARELSSGKQREELYASYANKMKRMAEDARKILRTIKPYPHDKQAAEKYKTEIDSLNKKLDIAEKNRPLERAAQLLGNVLWEGVKATHNAMDGPEEKKQKAKCLDVARRRTGANKKQIYITDKEWEAIQARAVSSNKLKQIIGNADKDRLKELAIPKERVTLSSAQLDMARQKIAGNATIADVAKELGVSFTTLNSLLYSKK